MVVDQMQSTTTEVEQDEIEREELVSLRNEFKWVMENEVHDSLRQLTGILSECVKKFPMTLCGLDRIVQMEKFVLSTPSTSPPDQLKVVVTITGETISHADINLKLPKQGKDYYVNTAIREDCPWRLQQVQDAGNYLQYAMTELSSIDQEKKFRTTDEVDSVLTRVMSFLQRSRSALVNPKKRTLEELHNSKQVKSLTPPLPMELAVSFYIQNWKLIFAAYHIVQEKTGSKFNRYQAECVVPWINDVLLLLTIGMQTAQQLKDKVNIFTQYPDLDVNTAMSD